MDAADAAGDGVLGLPQDRHALTRGGGTADGGTADGGTADGGTADGRPPGAGGRAVQAYVEPAVRSASTTARIEGRRSASARHTA
ncbi:hypothetical protein FGF04_38135 [Streptomyces apricus]|uniref:Uncharacterized protein n=1 Tax=Streptomyces apricus TaxID=1828112 RepID=A0A5A9ZKG2_9ACTN|nr:hypothetical protein FGF04_38135 [Streptomyces apricus]